MRNNPRPPLFYGWYVLTATFFILFLAQGARTVIGVMFKPVIAELSLSRSALSLAALVNMAVFAGTLTLIGKYYDRYGARHVIIFSSLFLAAGYIGISGVHSIWSFILLYGILAAVGFGGTSVPLCAALVSKWFHRYRGLVVSVAIAGGCLGQYVLVPTASWLVLNQGWRVSFAVFGSAVLAINLLLAYFLIREKPEDLNLEPYGYAASPGGGTAPGPCFERSDLRLADAMRTPSFWFYLIVMFVCGGGDYLVITHLVPMVSDTGIPALTAARMLGWAGFFSFIGVLITGPATDRFGNKMPVALTFLLRAVIFVMVYKYQTVGSYYIFAFAFGFTMLVTAPVTTTLMGKLYGFTHIGLITGFITTVHHFSGGLWAYLGGVIYDASGSYLPAFGISAVMSAIACGCAMMIDERRHAVPAQKRH